MLSKVLQLTTGELVIGMIETEDIDYSAYTVILYDPIRVESMKMQAGGLIYETYVMKPLVPMSKDPFVSIQTSEIVFCSSLSEKYEEQYKLYVQAKAVQDSGIADKEKEDFNPFKQTRDSDSTLDEDWDDEDEEEIIYDNSKRKTLH